VTEALLTTKFNHEKFNHEAHCDAHWVTLTG